eukprot:5640734-Prymnesium_polylepis.1
MAGASKWDTVHGQTLLFYGQTSTLARLPREHFLGGLYRGDTGDTREHASTPARRSRSMGAKH